MADEVWQRMLSEAHTEIARLTARAEQAVAELGAAKEELRTISAFAANETARAEQAERAPKLSDFLDWVRERYGDHPAHVAAQLYMEVRGLDEQSVREERTDG